MLAFQSAGVPIKSYTAYEIDKYAIQTTVHNFPEVKECGDVFTADFSQYKDIDYLIGGSPCTYWSIAQKNNRETEASGMGWELFSQYVRALREVKPKYFIYENNKSMSQAIRDSITKEFGFDAVCINSALVSAQNRQRLYWVGKRNDDGTYSKVNVEQPEDRGILLKDILDCGGDLTTRDKAWTLTASYDGAVPWNTIERSQRNMVAEPVIMSTPHGYNKGGAKYEKTPTLTANGDWQDNHKVLEPVNTTPNGKSQTIKAQYQQTSIANMCCYTSTYGASGAAEPVCMRYERSETAKKLRKDYEAGKVKHGFHEFSELHPRQDGKTNTLSTVLKDNLICESVIGAAQRGRYNENGEVEQTFEVREDDKSNCVTTVNKDCMVAIGVDGAKQVGALPRPNGELSTSQGFRIYDTEGKSVTLKGNAGGAGGKTGLYAIDIEYHGYAQPCEWDENGIPTKAISGADGKKYVVYEVRDGQITIKDKTYPIKLKDGYYIIRKLTVTECKRLQTVPEWYEFPISDSQAYRCLGNGWTIEVIAHLIKSTLAENTQ